MSNNRLQVYSIASGKYRNATLPIYASCKCSGSMLTPAPPLLTMLPLEGSIEVIGELLKGDCRLRLRGKIKYINADITHCRIICATKCKL